MERIELRSRECVRIARLAKNDSAQVNKIIDTFAKYGCVSFKRA
jgi:hypothetical protein